MEPKNHSWLGQVACRILYLFCVSKDEDFNQVSAQFCGD